MRTRLSALAAVLLLLPALSCSHAAAPVPAAIPRDIPQAVPVRPDPRIGALFLDGTDMHACTASVLDSTGGDLLLTAAHCIAGDVRADFLPAFAGDYREADRWQVDAVYIDPRWARSTDPHADYAIVRVHRAGSGRIEEVVGSGLRLGPAPAAGTMVTVTGYPYGVGGGPVGCQGPTADATGAQAGFPLLSCAGLVDGTSGAPWVSGSTIRGLTGGYDRGGCDDDVSFSAPFDANIERLLARAQAGGPGDIAPNTYSDTC